MRIHARRLLRSGASLRRGGVFLRLAAAVLIGLPAAAGAVFAVSAWYHVQFNRERLPDLRGFIRFDLPTIGRINDANGHPLLEVAREYREITRYEDIPAIVRDAIVAAEDKRFFAHNGLDYLSVPRVLAKVRLGTVMGRLWGGADYDEAGGAAIFPQGGSTITQQLVRASFLRGVKAQENSYQLQHAGVPARAASAIIGARSVNMLARKREEMRLSLWLEQQMRQQFGSKRRAKEEILGRYASAVYMGHGQYGFARAATYYFGRPLSSFTADDADKAALLAGIAKSPRDYAPDAKDSTNVRRRRDQILSLMAEQGSISHDRMRRASQEALPPVIRRVTQPFRSSAVVEHVLDELRTTHPGLGIDDLLSGEILIDATVDARVQAIVSEALEHGLQQYETRHPRARGVVQGSVVVLRNRDGAILAETGGRQVYHGRATGFSDFNRVRRSLRQPGSAMKPMVYLAAFQRGNFTLQTVVPDEPISVPDGVNRKWISNYDGRFRGPIPIREALAESRNAVAIWLTEQIGIDAVLRTSRSLGVQTPLHRYAVTALGASEVNLLELATAYRTIASGTLARPYVIRQIVRRTGEVLAGGQQAKVSALDSQMLALIQEGLRGVVRMPTGTAHTLDSRAFPIAVMGKTGTTSDFRDALFIGSTYGAGGITVAVRIGFDDNRSLGSRETGGRVALPVFRDVMLAVYRDGLVGPAPAFPDRLEQRITSYLQGDAAILVASTPAAASPAMPPDPLPED